jgi:FkbM family methyltransferase
MKQLPFKVRNWTSKEQWRINTFWDKEPETLLWIESFEDRVGNNWFSACNRKVMFFDIGANIGLYSLYAATLYPDLLIIAVEPQLENFQSLLANIKANNFSNIVPVYAGICARTCIAGFKPLEQGAGSAGGQITSLANTGDTEAAIDTSRIGSIAKEKLLVVFRDKRLKKIMVYDMDLFCTLVGYPTFFKMDIDGGEYEAISSMERLFRHENLDSMLIEFTRDARIQKAVNNIFSCGFTAQNEFNILPDHSKIRREKRGINVENIVFTRKKNPLSAP